MIYNLGHLAQPKPDEILQGNCELFLKNLKTIEDTSFDFATIEFKHYRLLRIAYSILYLQSEKLNDALKYINTPHAREDGSHEPKSSAQCLAAARVALSEFEAFKKVFKV